MQAGPSSGLSLMQHLLPSIAAAWRDWWSGTRNVRGWWTLARYDIVLRYRRSMLGPLWLTISMGLMLLGIGPLYTELFGVSKSEFFPHLALGIIFWQYFAGTINDGCTAFSAAANHIKQGDNPLAVFGWRVWARNLIQFAHHIVLVVPIAIWAGIGPAPANLLFFAGFPIVLANLLAATFTLGIVCARFRDVPPIVSSLMQFLMFVTPVFWLPDKLPPKGRLLLLNPFAQLLDVVRGPLLDRAPPPGVWASILGWTILNVAVAAIIYARKRSQVVYWL